MKKLLVYVHGKGGSANEAEHYIPILEEFEVIGFDYRSDNPWDAREEFRDYFKTLRKTYDSISVLANSIGAYFSMISLDETLIDRAFFVSPIVDMEELICNMIKWAGTTEEELREKGTMITSFGETLSWKYLNYVRCNPVSWSVPTDILYAQGDTMTSVDTLTEFSKRTGAALQVMEGGEHWFHTKEQMQYLDTWLMSVTLK